MPQKTGLVEEPSILAKLFRLRIPIIVLAQYFTTLSRPLEEEFELAQKNGDLPAGFELFDSSFKGLWAAHRNLLDSRELRSEHSSRGPFHRIASHLYDMLCDEARFPVSFLEMAFKTPYPASPYFDLLETIFGGLGNWKCQDILEYEIREILASKDPRSYSLEEFSRDLRASIFTKLRNGAWSRHVSDHDRVLLDSAIASLSGRRGEVIRLRFGLDTGVPMTLKEVGKCLGVRSQRAHQIEGKALAGLRHPKRKMAFGWLKQVGLDDRYDELGSFHALLMDECEKAKAELSSFYSFNSEKVRAQIMKNDIGFLSAEVTRLTNQQRRLRASVPDDEVAVVGVEVPGRILDEKIDDIEMPARVYTCVKNTGSNTIGELIKYTEADIRRRRGVGVVVMAGIKSILSDRGLRLGMKVVRV